MFVDIVDVNDGGTAACECNDCFTGPDCSTPVRECRADSDSGDPLLFEAYWRANPNLGTVVIPGWYRMSYLTRDNAAILYTDALLRTIRDLHGMVGNAVTKDRYIVVGTGSMQLINAVVHSLALLNSDRVSSVVAKAPYYSAYKVQTEYLDSPLFNFARDPARFTGNATGRGAQIELIASPNNPDAQIQEVPQNISEHVIYDHAYNWPHLSPITKASDHDIMLFTLSKITGHAGSRIGWAIIKDYNLYRTVQWYVVLNTLGVSHESQLRATQLIRTIIKSYSEGIRNEKGLFHYGREVLESRWATIQSILKNSSRFSLQELKPDYCFFFAQIVDPSPGHAWIRCNYEEDVDCAAVMLSAGIIGRKFGSGNRFVRLSLLKRRSHFEILTARLTKLVAQTSSST